MIDNATRLRLIQEDPRSEELIKPTLRGRDLSAYYYNFSNEYILFTRRGIDIEAYSAVKTHLFSFFERLKPRNNGEETGRKAGSYNWFEIQDNTAYFRKFAEPKIIWGELSDSAKFTYDDAGHFVEATTFFLTGGRLKYLLALFNSRAAAWYFNQITTTSGMGTTRWKKYKIEQLPTPLIPGIELSLLDNLVDKILLGKSDKKSTVLEEVEIDARILKLYGLSINDSKYVLSSQCVPDAEQELILAFLRDL